MGLLTVTSDLDVPHQQSVRGDARSELSFHSPSQAELHLAGLEQKGSVLQEALSLLSHPGMRMLLQPWHGFATCLQGLSFSKNAPSLSPPNPLMCVCVCVVLCGRVYACV